MQLPLVVPAERLRTIKTYKRHFRNYLIYPSFQLGLIGAQALILTLAFMAVGWENSQAFAHMRQLGVNSELPLTNEYFRFVDVQAREFLFHTTLAFGVALLISSALTLYFSFRLAGPIRRLKQFLDKIAKDGAPAEKLQFRKGDFYSDLPPLVNEATRRLTQGNRR